MTGHVVVRLTNTGPENAVVRASSSAPGGAAPPPVALPCASFTKSDDVTQGNWTGVYGSKGFGLAGDVAALPSGAGHHRLRLDVDVGRVHGRRPRRAPAGRRLAAGRVLVSTTASPST